MEGGVDLFRVPATCRPGRSRPTLAICGAGLIAIENSKGVNRSPCCVPPELSLLSPSQHTDSWETSHDCNNFLAFVNTKQQQQQQQQNSTSTVFVKLSLPPLRSLLMRSCHTCCLEYHSVLTPLWLLSLLLGVSLCTRGQLNNQYLKLNLHSSCIVFCSLKIYMEMISFVVCSKKK